MNPLGWNSVIYNLGRSADMPMGEVADDLLRGAWAAKRHDVAPTARAPLVADQLVLGLGDSRETYGAMLLAARSGVDDAKVVQIAEQLEGSLKAASQVRLNGAAIGHAQAARVAAEEVVGYLRRGIGPDQEPTHMALWNLRYHLDEGWNALGTAKVLGELRGKTSAI